MDLIGRRDWIPMYPQIGLVEQDASASLAFLLLPKQLLRPFQARG